MSNQKKEELNLCFNAPILESGFVNDDFIIQGTAINATITDNNHKFMAEELRESANSLTGVPLLVDHRNEISAIKGRVISGDFDEENSRINFKAKVKDADIKKMIKDGLINSVSVGATVKEIEEDGESLIPRGITFKELSLVAVPADAHATFGIALKSAFNLFKESLPVNPEVIMTQQVSNNLKGGNIMEAETKTEQTQNLVIETKVESKEVKAEAQVEEQMEKCPECDKMVDKKNMKAHMEKHNSEDKTKEMMAENLKLKSELESLKAKAIKEEVEVEEVEEKSKLNIVQGLGSIRGGAFTYMR